MTINKKVLTIKTIDNCYECGFGANVTVDNQYIFKDNKIPKYFIDGHGHKIFFATTDPENYLK